MKSFSAEETELFDSMMFPIRVAVDFVEIDGRVDFQWMVMCDVLTYCTVGESGTPAQYTHYILSM